MEPVRHGGQRIGLAEDNPLRLHGQSNPRLLKLAWPLRSIAS